MDGILNKLKRSRSSRGKMDFGNDPEVGQLWKIDRQCLYETIIETRPEIVFEVGTWKGGGSTYYIASALRENAKGKLYTVEYDPELYRFALDQYEHRWRHLRPFVKFHLGDSLTVYPPILADLGRIDVLMMDGSDEPAQAMAEMKMFEPYLQSGAVLIMHDWGCRKSELVKPYIEANRDFQIVKVLCNPDLGFERGSVGFAKVIRL
jgi:predicted O-methyltransferase YrrM